MDESRVEISATPGMFGSSLCGKREIDEDFIACGDFFGVRVAVLCDGMGGEASGEVSSKLAAGGFVKGIGSLYTNRSGKWTESEWRHKAYRKLVEKCHDSVNRVAGGPGLSGTTLTAVVLTFEGKKVSFFDIVNIGDSRCYVLDQEGPRLLTDDHSVTGDMVRAGYIDIHEIPETSGNNVLTRNIGDKARSEPDVWTFEFRGEVGFLICCDGVWDPLHGPEGLWLPDSDIFSRQSADTLVKEAIDRGSTDNCSVLIIEIED